MTASVDVARAFMTPREAAEIVRRPVGTLAQWRARRVGPRYWRSRGRVFYDVAAITAWLDAERREGAGPVR